MNESIGVNLSKVIDNLNKRVKVPAITQRKYDKECCEKDDYIAFYKDDGFDNSVDNDKYSYLDGEEYADTEELDENNYDEECSCSCCDNLDKKTMALIGMGAVIGIMGLYILFKKK